MNAKRLAVISLLAAAGTACGHGSGGAAFTVGADGSTCLVHQMHKPTTAYEGGTTGTSTDVLAFLGYFTAHGTQKFCDGKSATTTDKAWGELYVKLTTNSAKVSTILG